MGKLEPVPANIGQEIWGTLWTDRQSITEPTQRRATTDTHIHTMGNLE